MFSFAFFCCCLAQIAQEYPEGGLPAEAVSEVEGGGQRLRVPEGEGWDLLIQKHPRWRPMLLHHGTHVTASAATNKGGVIAAELLEITMRSTVAEAATLPTVIRKLPGGLPLKSVKLILCQLFKVATTLGPLPSALGALSLRAVRSCVA